jgi:hypothetical protein
MEDDMSVTDGLPARVIVRDERPGVRRFIEESAQLGQGILRFAERMAVALDRYDMAGIIAFPLSTTAEAVSTDPTTSPDAGWHEVKGRVTSVVVADTIEVEIEVVDWPYWPKPTIVLRMPVANEPWTLESVKSVRSPALNMREERPM